MPNPKKDGLGVNERRDRASQFLRSRIPQVADADMKRQAGVHRTQLGPAQRNWGRQRVDENAPVLRACSTQEVPRTFVGFDWFLPLRHPPLLRQLSLSNHADCSGARGPIDFLRRVPLMCPLVRIRCRTRWKQRRSPWQRPCARCSG